MFTEVDEAKHEDAFENKFPKLCQLKRNQSLYILKRLIW